MANLQVLRQDSPFRNNKIKHYFDSRSQFFEFVLGRYINTDFLRVRIFVWFEFEMNKFIELEFETRQTRSRKKGGEDRYEVIFIFANAFLSSQDT